MHTVFTANTETRKKKKIRWTVLAFLLKQTYGLHSTHKGNIDKHDKYGE